jgi:hypothetical protein
VEASAAEVGSGLKILDDTPTELDVGTPGDVGELLWLPVIGEDIAPLELLWLLVREEVSLLELL